MKGFYIIILGFVGCLYFIGCTTYTATFTPPVRQNSEIILKENDFRYVERNLEGDHECWFIGLGFWFIPFASFEIPVDDPRLYSNALADLYSNSNELSEGKPSQMINWTADSYSFIIPTPYIYAVKKYVKFRSDLIEFTK
jgi:hypothetical protein